MITIAAVQFAPKLGNLKGTIAELDFLLQSIDQKVDLILLPELANSGYNFNCKEEALKSAEAISKSVFLDFLKEYAKKMSCAFVTGFCEKTNDKLYNSSVFLDENGVLGHYRKLHLFLHEKKIFEVGNLGLPVFKFKNYKLGMMICFDYMFPEVSRQLALKDADFICHPCNLVTNYAFKIMPALALMNSLYIVTCNRIGIEKDLRFIGKSLVVDYRGNIITSAKKNQVEIIYSQIFPKFSRNKWVTPRNHVFLDRRLDVYPNILEVPDKR
ncbi:MAG: nitrilase-related carbon-nitrogen hydrolase [Bacteroidales bacterium]